MTFKFGKKSKWQENSRRNTEEDKNHKENVIIRPRFPRLQNVLRSVITCLSELLRVTQALRNMLKR